MVGKENGFESGFWRKERVNGKREFIPKKENKIKKKR